MDNTEAIRLEETRRLIRWIKQNPNEWLNVVRLLRDGDDILAKEAKSAIRIIKESGFYQLLVVMAYMDCYIVKEAVEKAILDNIADSWNEKTIDYMVNRIIENIA